MPTRVLLACMPKSGSTFLCNAIAALPGFTRATLVPEWGRREQELEESSLEKASFLGNFVAQHHVRYSDSTRNLIAKHKLSSIVLVRNIYDVIPSFIDHHRNESLLHPMAFVPEGIQSWSFEKSALFVTNMIIPWYFNFYLSWNDVQDKLLVKYENWVSQPDEELSRICRYLQLDVRSQDIRYAISTTINASPRKNSVLPGRGELLPQECIDRIDKMAHFYPDVDFSALGITALSNE